jgi:3-deoxy-7-phosphoheptulonate synthase
MTENTAKKMTNTKTWTPESWREFPIKQQPAYDDQAELDGVLDTISQYPSLVTPNEVRALTAQLAGVCHGEGFLLQGGDCAESFAEFNQDNLKNYFRVILQMTAALMYGTGKPVVKVGRIAGQFAKPRSDDFETIDGVKLPSYRGDIINSIDFTEAGRRNNPDNLLKAYNQSSSTLNYLRALAKGGEASLRNISRWNDEFITSSRQGKRFSDVVGRIDECFSFIEACGLDLDQVEKLKEASFFVSHEGLLMPYEQAQVKWDEETEKYYACSAHMLWIGDRTRALEDAHVEFFRGIANPVASKVGPSMKEDELIELIHALNPRNEAGRLTLISRMGAAHVQELLPKFVRRVKAEGLNVIWSCDPMHGNTIKSPNGIKTRPFNDILAEVRGFFAVHQAEGTYAGGVHFEMTGQDVTECIGGAQAISEVDLKNRYHTHCDPRLNASQSLELAFLISEEMKKHK